MLEIGATALSRRRSAQARSRPANQRPTVVIGAGPNGLAAAAHLIEAGVETLCFGQPLEAWQHHMPAGMLLRSQWRSSHIASPRQRFSLDAYVRDTGSAIGQPRLSREEFIAYGRWFARQLNPGVDPRRIASVARQDDHWQVRLADGQELEAERVVVASGITTFGSRPEPFDTLPRELCSHAYEHADLSGFAGRRVAVIGSGQSALECAALLHEHGAEVSVLCRGAGIHWLAPQAGPAALTPRRTHQIDIPQPPSDIGGPLSGWAGEPDLYRRLPPSLRPTIAFRCIRPAAAAWLRPRLSDVPFRFSTNVVSAHAGEDAATAGAGGAVELRLSDGSVRRADHVLLGTGYDVDVRRYPFLAPELSAQLELAGGYPVLGPGCESSLPGLHFVGATAAHSFGPLMRFVVGTWYAAPAVARTARGARQPPVTFSFRQAGVPLDRH